MNRLTKFVENKYVSITIVVLNVLLFLVSNDRSSKILSLACICSVVVSQLLKSIHKDNNK